MPNTMEVRVDMLNKAHMYKRTDVAEWVRSLD